MKLNRKEDFILRKLVARELKEARMEFWGAPSPARFFFLEGLISANP